MACSKYRIEKGKITKEIFVDALFQMPKELTQKPGITGYMLSKTEWGWSGLFDIYYLQNQTFKLCYDDVFEKLKPSFLTSLVANLKQITGNEDLLLV